MYWVYVNFDIIFIDFEWSVEDFIGNDVGFILSVDILLIDIEEGVLWWVILSVNFYDFVYFDSIWLCCVW